MSLTVRILGVPLSSNVDQSFLIRQLSASLREGRSLSVTFVNPSSYFEHVRNETYRSDLDRFDLVLPDGIGFVYVAQALSSQRFARLSFDSTSLAMPVLQLASERNYPVAIIGGKPGVAALATLFLERQFPSLKISNIIDGFQGVARTVQLLKNGDAKIVLVGMGIPNQERMILSLLENGWKGCAFSCGGYLDQLGSGLSYYPRLIDRFNLRALYRLWREPQRLWRRYLLQYNLFILAFFMKKLFSIELSTAIHAVQGWWRGRTRL